MSEGTTTFICRRGGVRADTVKVQLELPLRILEGYKEKAKEPVGNFKYTPKQIMENLLTNYIDGVKAGSGQ